VSIRVEIVALIMFLALIPITCASSMVLGHHQVTFNVSEPYNSSAKLDTPYYNLSASNDWTYVLNMTVDSQHALKIMVNELTIPDFDRTWPNDFAVTRQDWIKTNGIGGYKSSTMDFKGYPTYQESYPAQKIYHDDGTFVMYLQHNSLNYEPDEKTVVHIIAVGDNVPYQEVLESIKVVDV